MGTPLRVLLIEDCEDDARLVLRELCRAGYAPVSERVDTAPALAAALAEREWDIVLCDYVMPQFSGTAALERMRGHGSDLPVIIVSGEISQEAAIAAMRAGARDFVMKDGLARLAPAVARELREAEARRERRRAEEALRQSEIRYRELVENLSEVIFTVDTAGHVTYVSPNVESIGGYCQDEIVGRSFTEFVHPEDLPALMASYQRTIAGHLEPSEYRVLAKSGNAIWVRTSSRPIVRDGEVAGLQAVLMDITDRREAEGRQQLLALLVEQAPIGIVRTDASGQVTGANPAALRILGSPSEEATRQFNVLSLPNLREAGISAVFERTIVEKVSTQVEAPYRSYWGRESVVRMQIVPLLGRAGDVHGTLAIIEDTTERAQWASALRASEQRLRSVLDGLGPSIFVALLDLDGRILEGNQPWLAVAGGGHEDLRGRVLDGLPEIGHSAAVVARVRAGIGQAAGGVSWRGDVETRLRSGRVMVVDLFLGPLVDEAGRVAYIVGSGVDVTDRTLAEAGLRRLNAELERRVRERTAQLEAANKELEAFTSSVSHDLRAPLRVVDGFSEALALEHADRLDDQARAYVQRIRGAAARMGQLIDDLLTLARVSHRHLDLTRVELGRLAHWIAGELQRSDPERRVTFAIADDVEVRGDARLLRVALENLLGNAWKYSSKHPTARIEFGVRREDGGAVYFVRDDGAGFDMHYADKLFVAFQRLHGSEFEGTGIGLATVARIIHRHGGRIWAEGAVEQGATVYFTLPNAEP